MYVLTVIADAIGFGAAGFGDDVEVLPAEHLGADIGPDPLDPAVGVGGQVGGGDDIVGPDQGQVAEQDRRRHAELFGGPVPLCSPVQRRRNAGGRSASRAGWPNRR